MPDKDGGHGRLRTPDTAHVASVDTGQLAPR
jgi:hypothetical protein